MEPGPRQLALRTTAISGRHGTWRGQLAPGEFAMCAVAAGGQVRLEAPGEVLRIVVSRPAWLVVSWPAHAAVQAARAA
eukprot:1168698-Alexandrium_andersonii.AAC.1